MEKHLVNINRKVFRFLMVGLSAFFLIGVNQVQAAPDADSTNKGTSYKKCVKEKNEFIGTWQGYKGGNSEGWAWIFAKDKVTEQSKDQKQTFWYKPMGNDIYMLEGEGITVELSIKTTDNILTMGNGRDLRKFKRQTPSPDAKYLQCRMMGKWESDDSTDITKDKIKYYNSSGKLVEESYRLVDEKTIEVSTSDRKILWVVSFGNNNKKMTWVGDEYHVDGRRGFNTLFFYKN